MNTLYIFNRIIPIGNYFDLGGTGCVLNIVFFFENLKIFRTLAFLCFPPVSVCVHTRQVENQRCSRTCRVKKNHKILRNKHNI